MKKLFRMFFSWVFKEELDRLNALELRANNNSVAVSYLQEKLGPIIENTGVAVDVHQYSNSWAVICIQGEQTDFIKFVNLGKTDIRELQSFLRRFDRELVDAFPPIRGEILSFRHLEKRPRR